MTAKSSSELPLSIEMPALGDQQADRLLSNYEISLGAILGAI